MSTDGGAAAPSMLAGNPDAAWMRMSGGSLSGGERSDQTLQSGGSGVEGGSAAAPSMLASNPNAVWQEMKGGSLQSGGATEGEIKAAMKSIAFRLDQYGITFTATYDKQAFLADLYAVYTNGTNAAAATANENFKTTLNAFHVALTTRYGDRQFMPYPIQKMAGLDNSGGNACYINASLQLIASMPDIKYGIVNLDSTDASAMQVSKYFTKFVNASVNGIESIDISHRLCPAFQYTGAQDDSADFLERILGYYPDISQTYLIKEQKYLKCDSAQNYTPGETINPLYFLSLYVNDASSIQGSINKYMDPVDVDDLQIGGIQCLPPSTGKFKQQLIIPDENKYIIIRLKRYTQGSRRKLKTIIIPDDIIDISNNTYILSGCIVHSGDTIDGGHYVYNKYTESTNNNKILYTYNDRIVSEFPKNAEYSNRDYISTNGYVFLYRRLSAEEASRIPASGSAASSEVVDATSAVVASLVTPPLVGSLPLSAPAPVLDPRAATATSSTSAASAAVITGLGTTIPPMVTLAGMAPATEAAPTPVLAHAPVPPTVPPTIPPTVPAPVPPTAPAPAPAPVPVSAPVSAPALPIITLSGETLIYDYNDRPISINKNKIITYTYKNSPEQSEFVLGFNPTSPHQITVYNYKKHEISILDINLNTVVNTDEPDFSYLTKPQTGTGYILHKSNGDNIRLDISACVSFTTLVAAGMTFTKSETDISGGTIIEFLTGRNLYTGPTSTQYPIGIKIRRTTTGRGSKAGFKEMKEYDYHVGGIELNTMSIAPNADVCEPVAIKPRMFSGIEPKLGFWPQTVRTATVSDHKGVAITPKTKANLYYEASTPHGARLVVQKTNSPQNTTELFALYANDNVMFKSVNLTGEETWKIITISEVAPEAIVMQGTGLRLENTKWKILVNRGSRSFDNSSILVNSVLKITTLPKTNSTISGELAIHKNKIDNLPKKGGKRKNRTQKRSTVMRNLKRTASKRKHN